MKIIINRLLETQALYRPTETGQLQFFDLSLSPDDDVMTTEVDVG